MRHLLLSAALFPFTLPAQENLARIKVDPFIGTGGHGHTFPGACVPNGLVQLSPDTRPDGYMDWDGCGGYHHSDSLIYGFSHTHLSGTGVADLCDVLVMPMSGTYSFEPKTYRSSFRHATEIAHAGYYRVILDEEGTTAEMTATARCGVHRYSMPENKEQYLVVDLAHRDKLRKSSLRKEGNEIVGERRSSSWAGDQRLFFCMRIGRGNGPVGIGIEYNGDSTKAVIALKREDAGPIIVKVGISAVSVDGARKNLDAEVPGWDFDAVRQQAEAAWNAKLSKIQVSGGTTGQQRIFYTALYHCYVAPYIFNDVDGNYRGMDGQVHRADHNVYTVFSLWDTFRALHPLMTILEPDMTNDFINTFLLHYQQGGRLPVWELWGNETDCMIGYHSVSLITDAYMKGIRGYNAELALQAMVASAMRDEPGLNAYRTRGYISSEDCAESVSKTLEYAYDDWCVATMAQAMGKDSLARVFFDRSRNWQNLFDPATHFFRPRRNGGFIEPFDPYEVNFHFTEANAWQYAMFVPHDVMYFSELLGRRGALSAELDTLFTANTATSGREQADITGLIGQYAHGNEPSHHMASLYAKAFDHHSGEAKTHRILTEQYHAAPDGLSGNEDCGQMSAWYVMNAMGLYQSCPGDPTYAVGTPLFDTILIHTRTGDVRIEARHLSDKSIYLNDMGFGDRAESVAEPFIDHDDLQGHERIKLTLGDRPLHWGIPSRALQEVIWEEDRTGAPPAPIIQAPSRTFTDQLHVTIGATPGPWRVVLTPAPGPAISSPLGKPTLVMDLQGTTKLHAYTERSDGQRSQEVTATFSRIDGTRRVTLASTYANQYSAGGDQALMDGLRGGTDFRTGEWQGFEGQDLNATIDLGHVVVLKRAGLSVLQDMRAWVWYPSEVTIAWSTNGRTWSSTTVTNAVDRRSEAGQHQEMWSGPIGKKARYVKVSAKNVGPCPEWHPGKGGATWIFADEVLIDIQ